MEIFLLIHLFIVLALSAVILIQPSESEGFGAGSSSFSFMRTTSTGNPLTKVTAILAVLFFITSLGFSIVVRHYGDNSSNLLNRIDPPVTDHSSPDSSKEKEESVSSKTVNDLTKEK